MKRGLSVAIAALFLVGLLPGSSLASAPNIDISNDANENYWLPGPTLAQTFTADATGLMTAIDLKVGMNGSGWVNLWLENVDGSGMPNDSAVLATGGATATGSSLTATWLNFSLSVPVSVVAGTKYAIKFQSTTVVFYSNYGNPYAGGSALELTGSTWGPNPYAADDDFGFQTYLDTVQTQVQWSQPTVVGGVSTPLTLTVTMTFVNGAEATDYSAILLSALPTWFDLTGFSCPGSVSLSDCVVDHFTGTPGPISVGATDGGQVLVFTLTGNATPAVGDIGTISTAVAEGCLVIPVVTIDVRANLRMVDPGCSDGSGSVLVVAPAPPTPAPTLAPTPTIAPTPTLAPTPTIAPTPTLAPTPTIAPTIAPTVAPTPSPTPFETIEGVTAAPSVKNATPPPTSTGARHDSAPGGEGPLLILGLSAFFGTLVAIGLRQRRNA